MSRNAVQRISVQHDLDRMEQPDPSQNLPRFVAEQAHRVVLAAAFTVVAGILMIACKLCMHIRFPLF